MAQKIVTMKEKQMMLVANAKQHAVMRAVQERECRELQNAIGYRKERHKSLVPMMERKQKLRDEIREF